MLLRYTRTRHEDPLARGAIDQVARADDGVGGPALAQQILPLQLGICSRKMRHMTNIVDIWECVAAVSDQLWTHLSIQLEAELTHKSRPSRAYVCVTVQTMQGAARCSMHVESGVNAGSDDARVRQHHSGTPIMPHRTVLRNIRPRWNLQRNEGQCDQHRLTMCKLPCVDPLDQGALAGVLGTSPP